MSDTKYYRSTLSGLAVELAPPDRQAGEVAPQELRFVAYREKFQGDTVKVGYLATDNEVAHSKLANDPNVTEIKKKDFDEATTAEDSQELGH